MPQTSRILGPLIDELMPLMLAQPLVGEHLFEFYDEEILGFEPPKYGLVVVRVPDHWWDRGGKVTRLGPGVLALRGEPGPPSPWSDACDESRPTLMPDEEFHRRFHWFAAFAPPAALVSWLAETAAAAPAPLGYYHCLERGDDLYFEFAYLFGPRGLGAILAKETFLVDNDDNEECVVLRPEGRSAFAGSAFQRMLQHLGSPAEIQHFPPDHKGPFNWEPWRTDPAGYKHIVR